MFARGAFSLCLLLLAWTVLTRVSCQNVTVKEVSTEHVEVTWVRHHLWLDVKDFEASFSAEGSGVCIMPVACTTVTCSFSSVLCGVVPPCTPTSITISGGNYTAPTISRVTGPESVSAFEMHLHIGVEYIRWVNPLIDTSPCYEKTAVRVSYNDKESISYFDYEEETMNKSLCGKGSGGVEVWTEGGDGHSSSYQEAFLSNNMPALVVFDNCEPVGCTAIKVEWSYLSLCPDVDHITVQVGLNKSLNTSFSTTTLTVTGLTFDSGYDTYVIAKRKDGKILDMTSSKYCATRSEVPKNLTVEVLNSSSLKVTWDPPLCPMEPPVPYLLTADWHEYTTNATTYDVGGLISFNQYYIKVQMDRENYTYSRYQATTFARTLAPTPTLRIDSVQSDYVDVSWEANFIYHYSYVDYELTWGKDLQFEETTEEEFTITGFNSTDEVYQVCVATIINGREDLVSQTDCKLIPDVEEPQDGVSGLAIAGIVIGLVLVAALLAGGLFVAYYKNKNSEPICLLRFHYLFMSHHPCSGYVEARKHQH